MGKRGKKNNKRARRRRRKKKGEIIQIKGLAGGVARVSGRGPAPYNLLAWSRNCQPRRQAPAKGWSVAFFFFFFFSSSGTDSISQELLKKMKLFAIRTPPPLIIRMQWMITYVIPLSPPLFFFRLCCTRMVCEYSIIYANV